MRHFLRMRTVLGKDPWLLLNIRIRKWMSSRTGRSVFTFGDDSHGALGLPSSLTGLASDAYEPTLVPGLPSDITAIAAGHYHSLAITSLGQLWAWGRNNEAQLGRDLLSPRGTWREPKRVEGLDDVKVHAAFASGVVSAALGDDGTLWVWGKSKRGQLGLGKGIIEALVPSRVEALDGEKIAKVSFGWGHCLAQTEDGKLFGWGYSADGRLGRIGKCMGTSPLDRRVDGPKDNQKNFSTIAEVAEKQVLDGMEEEKNMPIIWEPSLIEDLSRDEVVDIACGLDHSLILCCDGTLFSGGSNIYGQLGRTNNDLGLLPVDISFRPMSIASGLGHSLAVCQVTSSDVHDAAKGILSWGWNGSSQLGRTGQENLPLMVDGLAGENPISAAGGRVHSIALTSQGEMWVWGCGKSGRLGLGSSCDEVEPILLYSLEGREVLQVATGFDHNLVLVAE